MLFVLTPCNSQGVFLKYTEGGGYVLVLVGATEGVRLLANHYFCMVYLRPELNSIAANCMPEVVCNLSYDFKRMLESCPQVAS
jgi:hypothetical protein